MPLRRWVQARMQHLRVQSMYVAYVRDDVARGCVHGDIVDIRIASALRRVSSKQCIGQ